MNEKLKDIRQLIVDGHAELAIHQLKALIDNCPHLRDKAYYLMGNAYRKMGNWQGALNSYQESIALNPESPAVQARQMVMDILNFYNKDMFNQ